MNVPDLRPLSFGEILDGAFTLYRRNFVTFAATSLIMTVALVAVIAVLGGATAVGFGDVSDLGALFGAMFGMLLVMGLVMGLIFCVLWTALTRQASQAYTGQPTSVADGLGTGVRSAFTVFLASVVAFLAIVVVVFAFGIVMALIQVAVGALGSALLTGVVGVVSVLCTLALYLAAMAAFFAVVPAIVVEGKGPVEAVSRSVDLMKGAPGQVVGIMLVTFLITYLPLMAVMAMTGGLSAVMNPDAVPSFTQLLTQQVLTMGVGVLTTPFFCSVLVLLYYDRRVRTEALDVQILADRLAVL
jgi:hypothetical protein